jgi:hypothetical protein
MLVTAAPGIDESNVRRIELPSVYPKPGSSGSMMKRERFSEITSSLRVGRCAISTAAPLSSRGNPLFDFLDWGLKNYLL